MMSDTRSLLVCAVALGVGVVISGHANAQTRQSSGWNYSFAIGSPAAGLPLPEAVVAEGRATWRGTHRFDFRSEVTMSHLPNLQENIAATPPCPPERVCSSPPDKPSSVAGISGHVIVNDDYITRGENKGAYYIFGGGVYRQLSPSAVGSIGGALEGGLGFKFGPGSLEIKAVYIRHWIGGDSGLIPVTLGFTW